MTPNQADQLLLQPLAQVPTLIGQHVIQRNGEYKNKTKNA